MNKYALDAFVKCAEKLQQLSKEIGAADPSTIGAEARAAQCVMDSGFEEYKIGRYTGGIGLLHNPSLHVRVHRDRNQVDFVLVGAVLPGNVCELNVAQTGTYPPNYLKVYRGWRTIIDQQSPEDQQEFFKQAGEDAAVIGIINKQEELRAQVEAKDKQIRDLEQLMEIEHREDLNKTVTELKGQLEFCHNRSELQRKEIDRLSTEKKLLTAKVEHFEKVEARQAHDLNKLRYWKEAYLASCRYRERLNHVIHKYKKRVARTHNALKNNNLIRAEGVGAYLSVLEKRNKELKEILELREEVVQEQNKRALHAEELLARTQEELQSVLAIANEELKAKTSLAQTAELQVAKDDIENLRHQIEISEKRLGHERQAVLGLQGQIREMAIILGKAKTDRDELKKREDQLLCELKQSQESHISDLAMVRKANSEKVTKIKLLEHDLRVRDGWLDDERKRVRELEARIEELTTEESNNLHHEIVKEFAKTVETPIPGSEAWHRFEEFRQKANFSQVPVQVFLHEMKKLGFKKCVLTGGHYWVR